MGVYIPELKSFMNISDIKEYQARKTEYRKEKKGKRGSRILSFKK
jgi:hypothetical protein